MPSPDEVRLSLAAAMELGLKPGLFYRGARLHCVNLLLTYEAGCAANCAFCGLSKTGHDQRFIRVSWPTYPLSEVIERLERLQGKGVIQRVCLSMVTRPRAVADTLEITRRLNSRLDLPLSLLIAPTVLDEESLARLKKAGAERIGVAVDCATPELFDQLRGSGVGGPHRWEHYWRIYQTAAGIFGQGMVGVHLICGLGESEAELAQAMQRAKDMSGTTHLFSFRAEAASLLAERPAPPLGVYRRVQVARWLIDEGLGRVEGFSFDPAGRIIDFGVPESVLEEVIGQGGCFMTSGCPGATLATACNRPFANERPGPLIRNFPFPPDADDLARCRAELFEDIHPPQAAEGGSR